MQCTASRPWTYRRIYSPSPPPSRPPSPPSRPPSPPSRPLPSTPTKSRGRRLYRRGQSPSSPEEVQESDVPGDLDSHSIPEDIAQLLAQVRPKVNSTPFHLLTPKRRAKRLSYAR